MRPADVPRHSIASVSLSTSAPHDGKHDDPDMAHAHVHHAGPAVQQLQPRAKPSCDGGRARPRITAVAGVLAICSAATTVAVTTNAFTRYAVTTQRADAALDGGPSQCSVIYDYPGSGLIYSNGSRAPNDFSACPIVPCAPSQFTAAAAVHVATFRADCQFACAQCRCKHMYPRHLAMR